MDSPARGSGSERLAERLDAARHLGEDRPEGGTIQHGVCDGRAASYKLAEEKKFVPVLELRAVGGQVLGGHAQDQTRARLAP